MIDYDDFRILARMQKNAREPQKNVAADLAISEASLSKKINRLYNDHVIRRQTIDIDMSKVGLNISAMTLLKEKKQTDAAGLQALLCNFPEAYQVHKVTGEWDYTVLWNCINPEHLDDVLSKVLDHPNVDKIQTFLFMRTLKQQNSASLEALLESRKTSLNLSPPNGGRK